ncbi:MAG: Tol-Pal system beta propeller repeat protein TolB [Gammaproteobacteria bacterium]
MKRIMSIFCVLCMSWSVSASAALTIEITQGLEGATPIAVVPFSGTGNEPENVAEIIAADLRSSGRFAPVSQDNMISRPVIPEQVRFPEWRTLGVEDLVIGTVESAGGDRYNIKFFMFDVYQSKKLLGFSVPTSRSSMRFDAHRISDLIYEKLTGTPGAFATRIAYVTDARRGNEREYKLQVSDFDGHNPKTILTSKEPLMSPAWSADGKQLAYVSFEDKKASIYSQNVMTAKRKKLVSFEGINGAPAWSPEGDRLALTLSRDGNPEIYIYTLSGGSLKRITRSPAIDTEPVWSPDGKILAFTSDRGGSPQIYKVSVNGGRAQRVTFEGKYNANADFSPDGKHLAVVHGESGRYRIAVLDIESGKMDILSDGRLDESPSFAPNGSMIIYATQKGDAGVLAAVSSDGRFRQQFTTSDGSVREPVWSSYVK